MKVKLAMIYRENGLPKKADHYLKDALSIDPENKAARREMVTGGSEEESTTDYANLEVGSWVYCKTDLQEIVTIFNSRSRKLDESSKARNRQDRDWRVEKNPENYAR